MRKKHLPTSRQLSLLLLSSIKTAAALLTLLLGLSGCTTVGQDRAKNLSAEEQLQLQTLLENGQDALRAGRIIAPSQRRDSVTRSGAAEFFYQALAIQPNNPAAQRGLEQILEQYVAQAIEAADAGDFSSSYRLLTQAKSIDPGHPSIEPAQAYVTTLDDADYRSIMVEGLSPSALSQIIDSLVLEAQPSAAKCRYRISAPSDSQTRSLYKALREGYARNNLNTRIRVSTTLSKPQRLERICTP